jgi:Cu+-exporting ATPase
MNETLEHSHAHGNDAPAPETLIDPVCGMTVKPDSVCSAKCLAKFEAEPQRYLHAARRNRRRRPAAPRATEYTCPMHPEVRQIGPGTCPKCGMTLEPVLPELEEGENPELADFRRRFWWTLPLTVLVTLIAMSGGLFDPLLGAARPWVELALGTPVVLWAGWPFFVRGVQSVKNRSPNMWTLIGLGHGAAWLYSVTATVLPGSLPASFRIDGHVAVYFEAAAVIISLTLLGQVLELKARSETGAAIKRPARTGAEDGAAHPRRQRGGHSAHPCASRRPPARAAGREGAGGWRGARRGQRGGRIHAHRRADAGGQAAGDKLIGATLNTSGALVMRAEKIGAQTVLAQIVQMVAQAQRSRAPMQRMADVVAGYFVSASWHRAADLLRLGPVRPAAELGLRPDQRGGGADHRLPLRARPGDADVGDGRHRQGGDPRRAVPRRGGDREPAQGRHPDRGQDRHADRGQAGFPWRRRGGGQQRRRGAAHRRQPRPGQRASAGADHRRRGAQAATQAGARRRNSNPPRASACAAVEGLTIVLGNTALMDEDGVDWHALAQQAEALRQEGASVMYLAVAGRNGRPRRGVRSDQASTPEAAGSAARRRPASASSWPPATASPPPAPSAAKLGIDEVHGEVKPQDKNDLVARLQAQGRIVAMAGDGINDAPALARADVGIAMGTGTDVAMNSAQLTLVKGDLRGIAAARRLSLATVRNMRQNLAFAFLYNALGVPIAAGVLYPGSSACCCRR